MVTPSTPTKIQKLKRSQSNRFELHISLLVGGIMKSFRFNNVTQAIFVGASSVLYHIEIERYIQPVV